MMNRVILTLAVMAFTAVGALAQTTKPVQAKQEQKKTCYVDADKNGVCDKWQEKNGKAECKDQGKKVSKECTKESKECAKENKECAKVPKENKTATTGTPVTKKK
ncbi:MAG: hypothetical protein RR555_06890 [Bacteroidales bacterium]